MRLLKNNGHSSYAIFWMVVEEMYLSPAFRFSETQNDLEDFADSFFCTVEELKKCIDEAVKYRMWYRDSLGIGSYRIDEEISEMTDRRAEVSKKRSASANKRWAMQKSKNVEDNQIDNMQVHASACKPMQTDANDAKIRSDQNRSDNIFLGVEAHAPEKKLGNLEIRKIITESLASAKLGKELDAITAQETTQPIEAPSLKLKNGTALNVGQNFKPLTDDITSNQMFVSLGRRPLEKYPEIWITPLELKQVLDTAFDKKVEAKEIFAQVSTFVKDKIQAGEPLHRIKAVPALLGWGLQEALNIQTAEIRRDNQKNYKSGNAKAEQPSPYKNFKVVS